MNNIRHLHLTDYTKQYFNLLNQLKPIGECSYTCFKETYDLIERNPNHFVFVIEEDNVIVGSITLLVEVKFLYKGLKLGHIEDVIVHNKYRNKGYGKLLVEFCKQYAKDVLGCHKIGLCSRKESERFYIKTGFHPIGVYYADYFSR